MAVIQDIIKQMAYDAAKIHTKNQIDESTTYIGVLENLVTNYRDNINHLSDNGDISFKLGNELISTVTQDMIRQMAYDAAVIYEESKIKPLDTSIAVTDELIGIYKENVQYLLEKRDVKKKELINGVGKSK